MSVPSNRKSGGKGSIGFYLVGVVCLFVGVYLSTITRINLLTDQTSYPFLGIGLPLATVGIVAVIVTQRATKQSLRK